MGQLWKQSSEYAGCEIEGETYLLPYGQKIADHKKGIRLNASGAYIWELLETGRTFAELLKLCQTHWQTDGEACPELEEDLRRFLNILQDYGIVENLSCSVPRQDGCQGSEINRTVHQDKSKRSDSQTSCEDRGGGAGSKAVCKNKSMDTCDQTAGENEHKNVRDQTVCENKSGESDEFEAKYKALIAPSNKVEEERYVKIAGLLLKLQGDVNVFPEEFAPFWSEAFAVPDQTILIMSADSLPHDGGSFNILLQSRELVVSETNEKYILLFPAMTQVAEAYLEKTGSRVVFFCRPSRTKQLRDELFHAIRLVFLYLAQRQGIVALHSASLLYQGRAWLFSGRSGMGKSTHTAMWKELLQTPLLNGDLNLLAVRDGQPVVYGLPWCGTSGVSAQGSWPLGGIILLRQSQENMTEPLSADRRCLLTAQRLVSPVWTEEQLYMNLRIMGELTPKVLVCVFRFTKETEAVEVIRRVIDEYVQQQRKIM